MNLEGVLSDLKCREPIFHHPDKFGRTKQDIIIGFCDFDFKRALALMDGMTQRLYLRKKK